MLYDCCCIQSKYVHVVLLNRAYRNVSYVCMPTVSGKCFTLIFLFCFLVQSWWIDVRDIFLSRERKKAIELNLFFEIALLKLRILNVQNENAYFGTLCVVIWWKIILSYFNFVSFTCCYFLAKCILALGGICVTHSCFFVKIEKYLSWTTMVF